MTLKQVQKWIDNVPEEYRDLEIAFKAVDMESKTVVFGPLDGVLFETVLPASSLKVLKMQIFTNREDANANSPYCR